MSGMEDKFWETDDTFLARWLADELTAEERTAFEGSEDFDSYKDIVISLKGIKKPSYDGAAHLERIWAERRRKAETKVIPFRRWGAIAAAACITAVIGFFWIFGSTTVETGYGEQVAVWLPDSSYVHLNANSSITFKKRRFSRKRKIAMTGEAFFQVRKGEQFSVESAHGVVTVLGTSFNVKSRQDRWDVVCYTGKVNVRGTSVDQDLMPGESVSVRDGTLLDFSTLDATQPDWTQDRSRLTNATVSEALEELKNVFGLTIEQPDVLPEATFTGTFPHSNAELAIKLVLEPLNIPYSYNPRTKTLTIKP